MLYMSVHTHPVTPAIFTLMYAGPIAIDVYLHARSPCHACCYPATTPHRHSTPPRSAGLSKLSTSCQHLAFPPGVPATGSANHKAAHAPPHPPRLGPPKSASNRALLPPPPTPSLVDKQTEGHATTMSTPKKRRENFFHLAQARVGESAPIVSAPTTMSLPPTKAKGCGTAQPVPSKGARMEGWSTQRAWPCASTDSSSEAAQTRATPSTTNAQAVESSVMVPKPALEQKQLETTSLYIHGAWAKELTRLHLSTKYPSIVDGFKSGFHLGIPVICNTFTPPNHPSILHLPDVYNATIHHEFAVGQYVGPLCVLNWRLNWAHSRPPPFPLSPKHPSPENFGPCTTSPFPTTHPPRQLPSTRTSIARISHAPGEPSTPWRYSSRAYPLVRKLWYATWQKCTGQSQPIRPNGRASSYASRRMINSPSMCATTLAYHRPEEYMGWLLMLALTFFAATESAHSPNGLMTTSFFASHANASLHIMLIVPYGRAKLSSRESDSKRVVASGTEEKTSWTATQRNLMRTAVSCSAIGQTHHHMASATNSLPTQTQTSMLCRSTLGSSGNPPRQFPSSMKSHTWGSSGTFARKLSACWKRKEPSTWLPSQSGRSHACTTCWTHSSCTGSFFTPPWSSHQDALTSPAWKPCSVPFITVLSYRTPHPRTLKSIWSGGRAGSANPTPPDPSLPLVPSSTSKPIQTRAPESESPSQLVRGGVPGTWPLAGNPRAGTSNGPRPLDLSYSSSTYSQFQARASTSRPMETPRGSSRDGGSVPAGTSPPTASSDASLTYRKSIIRLYT